MALRVVKHPSRKNSSDSAKTAEETTQGNATRFAWVVVTTLFTKEGIVRGVLLGVAGGYEIRPYELDIRL